MGRANGAGKVVPQGPLSSVEPGWRDPARGLKWKGSIKPPEADRAYRTREKRERGHGCPTGAIALLLADLRNAVIDSYDVNFSKSIRSKDSLVYFVHGTVRGQQVHYMAATLRDFRTDSTATLTAIQPGLK